MKTLPIIATSSLILASLAGAASEGIAKVLENQHSNYSQQSELVACGGGGGGGNAKKKKAERAAKLKALIEMREEAEQESRR